MYVILLKLKYKNSFIYISINNVHMANRWIMKKTMLMSGLPNNVLCVPKLIINPKHNNILHGLVGNYTTHILFNMMRKYTSLEKSITIINNNVKYRKIYNNVPSSYYYIFKMSSYDMKEFIDNPLFWNNICDENISYVKDINIGIDVFNYDTNEQIGFCTTNFDLSIDTIR